MIKGTLASRAANRDFEGASVVVADVNGDDEAEMQALERVMERIGSWPPVVAVTQTLRRRCRAPPDADAGGRLPGQAGSAG